MKIVTAIGKNVRGSARKARIPARVVIGMRVDEALPVLKYIKKDAAKDVYKVVHSARANALNNNGMKSENLIVKNIRVDNSFGMKRFKAGSRGMGKAIKKPFCHIMVELEDISAVNEVSEVKEVKEVAKKKTTKKPVSKTETTKKAKVAKDKK